MERMPCPIPVGVDCEISNKVVDIDFDEKSSMLVLHLEPVNGRKTAIHIQVDKAVTDKLSIGGTR